MLSPHAVLAVGKAMPVPYLLEDYLSACCFTGNGGPSFGFPAGSLRIRHDGAARTGTPFRYGPPAQPEDPRRFTTVRLQKASCRACSTSVARADREAVFLPRTSLHKTQANQAAALLIRSSIECRNFN